MSDSILVSISCITYNHEKYIDKCLKGFLNQQTNFGYEMLIHDDASNDKTIKIIKDYQHLYPEIIKPIFQTENQYSQGVRGIMARFNFPRAKGKYIALCEGDDYWTDPFKLQKQVDFMEQNDSLSFCFHGAKTLNSKGLFSSYYKHKQFKDRQIVPKKYFLESGGGSYCTASVVFRKDMIEDIPNYFSECPVGDLPLALLAITKGNIGYLKDEMAVYRLMTESSWSRNTGFEKKKKNIIKILETIKQFESFTKFQHHKDLKLLMKSIYYKYCIYNSKDSFVKSLKYAIGYYNKIGLKYSLKLIKDSI